MVPKSTDGAFLPPKSAANSVVDHILFRSLNIGIRMEKGMVFPVTMSTQWSYAD